MARVADARIIEVAQQTRATMRTLAEEGGHAVVAGGAVIAGGAGTVVDVLAAVIARPAIDADAVIAAVSVVAGPAVLTSVGHQLALIHILRAVLTCVMRRALTVVGIHPVHTHPTVLAIVTWTVIDVVLALLACESKKAAAVVGGLSFLDAGASILTRRGAARHVEGLASRAGVLLRTAAVVRAHLIHAHAAVEAGRGNLGALVHVLLAGLTVKGGWAGADEGGIKS